MKKIIIFLILIILLTSCQSVSDNIAIAIGLTQTAMALIQPTSSFTPTATNTPVPTNTPEPTSTPTPDIRIIDGDPLDFLLKNDDLPKESQFFLPDSSWRSRESNNEMLQSWGVDEGREYLEKTGRLDGQWVVFKRGSELLTAPEEVYCTVVKYETAQGAQISLSDYNLIVAPSSSTYTYTLAKEEFPDLGDTRISYFREWTADSGVKYTVYEIDITYFNFYVGCSGYGRKIEVRPEYVKGLIEIALNKLEVAPLISPY